MRGSIGAPRSQAPSGGLVSPGGISNYSSYSRNQRSGTGVRRHQFRQNADYNPTPGGPQITQQEYARVVLANFIRSDTAVANVDPTPTTGTNNFPTTEVMNGSYLNRYKCKIQLTNLASSYTYLDVYMCALSFFDARTWEQVYNAASPVTQNVTFAAVHGGEVVSKTPGVGQVDAQTIRESKFVQKYMKQLGTIELNNVGESGSVQEFIIDRIPPKCRRSQTGMYWAIYFANDALKNQGDRSVRIVADYDFDEIPSTTRSVEFPG